MFNNPFDSFHDTVAEAKEERERLDRLLTVSTPRERLLVAAIGLLLAAVMGWLFFGNVARSVALDGVLAGPTENPTAITRSVRAQVWVEREVAAQIEAGMPAVIEVARTDGGANRLAGQVAAVAVIPLPEEGAALESLAPVNVHRIDVALDETLDFASLAHRECRGVVELGRQPPVALFGTRRF